ALYLVFLAIAVGIGNFLSIVSWNYSGVNITRRTRTRYFESVLRKDVTYLDRISAAEITAHLGNDFDSFQEGISEKIGYTLFSFSTTVSAFSIAFYRNWKLAAVMTCVLPAMFVPTALLSMYASQWAALAAKFSTDALATAEEVLSSIRVVQSLGVPSMLFGKYDKGLQLMEKAATKRMVAQSTLVGNIHFVIFAAYALAFWEGTRLLMKGETQVGIVVNVLFVTIMGSFALGQTLRQLQSFGQSVVSGQKILEMIDRKPEIDIEKAHVVIPQDPRGEIVFKNVRFAYAGRPDVPVLDNFNLKIEPGKMTAIVGVSGSGKSTVAHLLNRLYDPSSGSVQLDGVDIRQYSVSAVRAYAALVPQDCVMFSKSVADNILDGLQGTLHQHNEVDYLRLIIDACKIADAHEFVEQLPNKYHTIIGPQGISLSGGQVQRLAIARAIISNPKLLVFDEATSALDVVSEERICTAVYQHRRKIAATTVVIAHKLSTIRTADKIVFVENGKVAEEGTHEQLVARKGAYYRLLEANAHKTDNLIQSSIIGPTSLGIKSSKCSTSAFVRHSASDFLRSSETESPISPGNITEKGAMLELFDPVQGGFIARHFQIFTKSVKLLPFNKNEPWMLCGFLGSILLGATYPAQTVIFASLVHQFSNVTVSQETEIQHKINRFCLYFFVIALCKAFIYVSTTILFETCNRKMIGQIRRLLFDKFCRNNISWFEEDGHGVATLLSILENCSLLQAFHCGTWSIYIAIAVNLLAAVVLSFSFAWHLAVVSTAVIPLYILTAFVRFKFLSAFQANIKVQIARSTAIACEAASSFRTVAVLGIHSSLTRRYEEALLKSQQKAFTNNLRASAIFSLSQSITYLANALLIWYGAKLIAEGYINTFGFFICFISVMFVAQDVSELFTHNPNRMGASVFYEDLLKVVGVDGLTRTEVMANFCQGSNHSDGSVEFQDVSFAYPGTPQKVILNGLNVSIKSGQYVAFVGASGQGKSTIVNLLQGFYQRQSGKILIEGQDIQEMDIYELRKSLGWVCQEPTIFDGTVKFNILLGIDQPDVPIQDLEDACRTANILEFIQSLPEGFNTQCGRRGFNLSGGQKQRIAIARALIRRPRILLLDEATSALDYHSELEVREGLKRACEGRTVLAIAHRLSSISEADLICVLQDGVIIESGSHDELMSRESRY
ncbi:P-loop containing nucleoside triphosphate hydrolase protein, partial [Stipitochalara longipes BDJ]